MTNKERTLTDFIIKELNTCQSSNLQSDVKIKGCQRADILKTCFLAYRFGIMSNIDKQSNTFKNQEELYKGTIARFLFRWVQWKEPMFLFLLFRRCICPTSCSIKKKASFMGQFLLLKHSFYSNIHDTTPFLLSATKSCLFHRNLGCTSMAARLGRRQIAKDL
jgi:hypothetical protein